MNYNGGDSRRAAAQSESPGANSYKKSQSLQEFNANSEEGGDEEQEDEQQDDDSQPLKTDEDAS